MTLDPTDLADFLKRYGGDLLQARDSISKRELFAALALAGVLSSPHTGDWSVEEHVTLAVQSADMLVAALRCPPSSLGRVDPCP